MGCEGGRDLVVLRNWQFLDVCAGKARITKWAMTAGLFGAAIDQTYGAHMNINTNEGFALLLLCLLRVCSGGLMIIAAQCSSWVWLSRSTSGRSTENPHGDVSKQFVRDGNLLNVRCSVVCAIAHMVGVLWVIEQPASSLFFNVEAMREVIKFCKAVRVHFFMDQFGHPAKKGTVLVGTAPWLEAFGTRVGGESPPAQLPRSLCSSSVGCGSVPKAKRQNKARSKGPKVKAKAKALALAHRSKLNGKQQVTGQRRALKESQVYPAKFALAVVKQHWPRLFELST